MARILIEGFQCERCSYRWAPRQGTTVEPKVCPKCKSRFWNKPRQKSRQEEYRAAQHVYQPMKRAET